MSTCSSDTDPRKSPRISPLRADLLLVHAPAFFDFRDRRDIYFPFLGTSGDVPITPLYEYFPVGFKTLQRYLTERGHAVKLLNLSTVLLRYPKIDVDELIDAIDAPLVGIDLHWMVHVQGSLALAERIKRRRPEIAIVFGGISSTYYARELIRYPFIDMVMRGYETHGPMVGLMDALRDRRDPIGVENLLWKSPDGTVRDNGLSHLPDDYSCGIDWSKQPAGGDPHGVPILEVLSTQNAGCSYNCGWCGGSREAFRRIFGKQRAMSRKPLLEVGYEFETMSRIPGIERYHFYSVGSYNEPKQRLEYFLDRVAQTPLKSISYEQFHLTPDDVLKRMAKANRRTIITLSPESADLDVAKLAGRGVYTNEEMEHWLDKALEFGIYHIDVWYFIGMCGQDENSVGRTVDYCRRLLEKFKGKHVNPMICPMIPFLDPASEFFEHPEKHGYRVFHRSVEEHRRGMERASLINRINYETRWLSRSDLVRVGFKAVKDLMEIKAELQALPRSVVRSYVAKVDDALEMIGVVHEADNIADPQARARELENLGDEIVKRNHLIFDSGVMNQAFPINRQIGGRWFDELGWDPDELERSSHSGPSGPVPDEPQAVGTPA